MNTTSFTKRQHTWKLFGFPFLTNLRDIYREYLGIILSTTYTAVNKIAIVPILAEMQRQTNKEINR